MPWLVGTWNIRSWLPTPAPTTATDVLVFAPNCPIAFSYAGADFDASFAPAEPFLCTAESCALARSRPAGIVTITLDVFVESNAPLSPYSSYLFTNSALVQAANPIRIP